MALGKWPCWATFPKYLFSSSRDNAKFSSHPQESFQIKKPRRLPRPYLDQVTNEKNTSAFFLCISPCWLRHGSLGAVDLGQAIVVPCPT